MPEVDRTSVQCDTQNAVVHVGVNLRNPVAHNRDRTYNQSTYGHLDTNFAKGFGGVVGHGVDMILGRVGKDKAKSLEFGKQK